MPVKSKLLIKDLQQKKYPRTMKQAMFYPVEQPDFFHYDKMICMCLLLWSHFVQNYNVFTPSKCMLW